MPAFIHVLMGMPTDVNKLTREACLKLSLFSQPCALPCYRTQGLTELIAVIQGIDAACFAEHPSLHADRAISAVFSIQAARCIGRSNAAIFRW